MAAPTDWWAMAEIVPGRVILGLLSAHLTTAEAQGLGLGIAGDAAIPERLQPDRAESAT